MDCKVSPGGKCCNLKCPNENIFLPNPLKKEEFIQLVDSKDERIIGCSEKNIFKTSISRCTVIGSDECGKFEESLIDSDSNICKDKFSYVDKVINWEGSVGEVIDIHRTGAKCISGEDSRLSGTLYHVVGPVRTKPGRGDPTLSVSCSDKLARWIACGLQGALLSLLLSKPVHLTSVVIGGGGPYSQDVLYRAIISRMGTQQSPALLQSSMVFPFSRYIADSSAKPCPSAILWSHVNHKALEVCVEGRRQGTTKKSPDNGRLMVCKLELLRAFLSVSGERYQGMTYRDIKASSNQYNNIWARAKSTIGLWTTKPADLESFIL